jgi:hypothetical protein
VFAASPAALTRQPDRRGPFISLFIVMLLVSGATWGLLVPPFEAPDESYFYKSLVSYARSGVRASLPLYAVLAKPVLTVVGAGAKPLQPTYNPSFRFISNERGRVNMFMHGRAEGASREDIRRMYALRAFTFLMWCASLLLVFETAQMYFGRSDLAFLAATLALSIPQLSFFSSKIHPEATATLLASIAYWLFAMRLNGRLGRRATWAVGAVLLIAAPFSDRQGYFVIPLVAAGFILTERWTTIAAVTAALAAPVLWAFTRPAAQGLRGDLGQSIAPILEGYRGWITMYNLRFMTYEFTPKLFFGFWGWLGQPSILLPPPIYAALAAVSGVAVAGLFLPSPSAAMAVSRRQLRRLLIIGFVVTLGPIVYYNVMVARTSHGRWMLPAIAPIAIGLVAGLRGIWRAARRSPHGVAGAIAAAAALYALAWMSPLGTAVRVGIRGNHYGDQGHFVATIGDVVPALLAIAAVVEIAVWCARAWPLTARQPALVAGAIAWSASVLLLFAFVLPLYEPLAPAELAAAVRRETAEGEDGRASALYRIGIGAYPEATDLLRLADELPGLLIGEDQEMFDRFQSRISRGYVPGTRAELMSLARVVRTKGWLDRVALAQVLDGNKNRPDLAEPLALLRAEFEQTLHESSVADRVIEAGRGVIAHAGMHDDDATLEGFTMARLPSGFVEVTVYFRPHHAWSQRHWWIHAYAGNDPNYLSLDPVPPTFNGWTAGELGWEVFRVPTAVPFQLFLGLAIGEGLGNGYSLGRVSG